MNLRHHNSFVLLVAAAAACSFTLVGCGSDSSSSAPTSKDSMTTTGAPATGVKITSLEIPATLDCNGKTSVDLTVSYAVEGAARQELYVDGRKVDGTDKSVATVSTWVHCDTLPHTIDVVGYDQKNHHTTLEKMVTTNL